MITKWFPAHNYNFERGRGEEKINLIVLHYSAGELLSQTDIKFLNPRRLASVHFAIENTEIHEYVKPEDTAFHSGSIEVDKRSIGIILTGGVNMPVTDITYQTLELFLEELCRKHRILIDLDHIKGHKEITKGECPGTLDIDRIVKATKALAPQSIIEKLKYRSEELQQALDREIQKPDLLTAKLEELRLVYSKKDEAYTKKCTDLLLMQMRNEKLEDIIRELLNRSVFTQARKKIKHFFRL